jgi:hypothetical protein
METSSEKNPTNDPIRKRYIPPKRESIEDHLAVIERRATRLGIKWVPRLATRAFILDLIKRKIINGPQPAGPKQNSFGTSQRFSPRDYRDLLEVIQLKSRGVLHRRSWIIHLFLRGHEYDIEVVRRSLIGEVEQMNDTVSADFAPTGRWTESFGVKYDRRVRKREEDEFINILEPAAALMLRPSAIGEIGTDPSVIAAEVAEMLEIDRAEVEPVIRSLLDATKTNSLVPAEVMQKLFDLLGRKLPPELMKMYFEGSDDQPPPIVSIAARVYGKVDDGSGRSRMVETISAAPESAFRKARKWNQLIFRSGLLERIPETARAEAPELGAWLDIVPDQARYMRMTARKNPWVAVQYFAELVADEVPPNMDFTSKKPLDSRMLLDALRDDIAVRKELDQG